MLPLSGSDSVSESKYSSNFLLLLTGWFTAGTGVGDSVSDYSTGAEVDYTETEVS